MSARWRKILACLPGYDAGRPTPGYWWDEAAANAAVYFIEDYCSHVKGFRGALILENWQRAIVGALMGWKQIGTNLRRYRKAFIYVPRKNGKTVFAAALALLILYCDGEPGAECYCAASDQPQSRLLFAQAAGMVHQNDDLSANATVYRNSIVVGTSSLQCISSKVAGKHGYNSHLVIVDEVHAQPNRDLVDVLCTGTGARRQPLIVFITTADFARESICNEEHDYACAVRDGPRRDPAYLPVIYEAPSDADWTDERVWKAANPNLGVSLKLAYVRSECAKARQLPTYENTFKRLQLNMRTEQDVRWLPMEAWYGCDGAPRRLEDFAGRLCYGGLDMSTTTDLSALALVFPDPDERHFDAVLRYWVPQENARQREARDRVPYSVWIREGWIAATPGATVDYGRVRAAVNEIGKVVQIKEIAADRWNATQLIQQLAEDGFEIFAHGQGFASMSAPSKELERCVADGLLRHGGNPVLAWNARNAAAEIDAAGNVKPSKKKSTERIDGIVALVMALGRAVLHKAPKPSVYESRSLLRLGGVGKA